MVDDILSDEDKALFRAAIKDVIPLKKNKRIQCISSVKPAAKIPQKPSISLKETPLQAINTFYLSDAYTEHVSPEMALFFYRYPLNPKQLKSLKKGLLYCENQLDLHGLSKDQAKEALIKTISHMRQKRTRNLLLIHGKGGMHQESSILKSAVNHWLRQIPDVLAFHSAQPKDGGNGALYVLLRYSQRF